jgi:hypothetical protein
VTWFDLREEHERRRTRDIRPRPGLCPRRGVRAVCYGRRDDALVRLVVLDFVDADAAPVERTQHRLVQVGKLGIALERRRADELADRRELTDGPGRLVRGDGLDEGRCLVNSLIPTRSGA